MTDDTCGCPDNGSVCDWCKLCDYCDNARVAHRMCAKCACVRCTKVVRWPSRKMCRDCIDLTLKCPCGAAHKWEYHVTAVPSIVFACHE